MSASKIGVRGSEIVGVAGVVAVVLAVAVGSRGTVGAQAGTLPHTLAGTWMFDGDPTSGMRTVEGAFAGSIASLPELLQGMARERIRDRMEPPRRIVLSTSAAAIRLTIESRRTTVIDGPLGSVQTVAGADGDTRVTPRLQGGWLEVRYENGESVMRQLFSTEPDGSRLHVDYTVESARLQGPVRYRLDYVRAPATR